MRIGILETGEVPAELLADHGDYPFMFARLLRTVDPGLEFIQVRVLDGEVPRDPRMVDAWLITGSRHGVYDDLPWIALLKTFLARAAEADVPMVGICFGHQILAEALGGRAVKSERGWGVGISGYRVTHRPGWLLDLPDSFALPAMHQDQVVGLPSDAAVIAASDHCPYAAVAFGDPERPLAVSFQAHPEYDADFMDALIRLRAGAAVPPTVAAEALARTGTATHGADCARAIVAYLGRMAST